MMRLLLPLLVLAALLLGCGGESMEKKLSGTWTVDMGQTKLNPDETKTDADKTREEGILKGSNLNLMDDKKFELSLVLNFKGTWAIQGSKVVLTPDAQGAKSLPAGKTTFDFEVAPEGKALYYTSDSPTMKGKLVFVKAVIN